MYNIYIYFFKYIHFFVFITLFDFYYLKLAKQGEKIVCIFYFFLKKLIN